jgi:hypothetical protein
VRIIGSLPAFSRRFETQTRMSQQMKAIEINRSPPVTPLEAQSAFGLNIKISSLSKRRVRIKKSRFGSARHGLSQIISKKHGFSHNGSPPAHSRLKKARYVSVKLSFAQYVSKNNGLNRETSAGCLSFYLRLLQRALMYAMAGFTDYGITVFLMCTSGGPASSGSSCSARLGFTRRWFSIAGTGRER